MAYRIIIDAEYACFAMHYISCINKNPIYTMKTWMERIEMTSDKPLNKVINSKVMNSIAQHKSKCPVCGSMRRVSNIRVSNQNN